MDFFHTAALVFERTARHGIDHFNQELFQISHFFRVEFVFAVTVEIDLWILSRQIDKFIHHFFDVRFTAQPVPQRLLARGARRRLRAPRHVFHLPWVDVVAHLVHHASQYAGTIRNVPHPILIPPPPAHTSL